MKFNFGDKVSIGFLEFEGRELLGRIVGYENYDWSMLKTTGYWIKLDKSIKQIGHKDFNKKIIWRDWNKINHE